MAGACVGWAQHGESGAWISDRLPHLAQVADKICIVRSMHTDAVDHDPAITFSLSGNQQPGRPSLGSWISYGFGSENRDLPAFVVMISHGSPRRDAQPLFARLWGSGFIPTTHQGVLFRSSGDPVLHLSDPPGIDHTRLTARHQGRDFRLTDVHGEVVRAMLA